MRLDNTGAFSYLFSSWVTGILFFEVKSNGYFLLIMYICTQYMEKERFWGSG